MGEARIKRRAHAAILANSPGCIYCAGANVATTIEHMPPISLFRSRQRPKGLEFPACDGCNGGTKHSDLVAALMAKTFTGSDSEEAVHADLKKALQGVANNVPQVLREMQIGRGGEKLARKRHSIPDDAYPLRADGPTLNKHLQVFSAKMGFALHYEETGTRIPATGGVQVMWFSNVQAMNNEIPSMLFEVLPAPKTLRQGTKGVAEQFQYTYALVEPARDHMLYYASFNLSFAVAGITALDRSVYIDKGPTDFPIFSPGDFLNQPRAVKPQSHSAPP